MRLVEAREAEEKAARLKEQKEAEVLQKVQDEFRINHNEVRVNLKMVQSIKGIVNCTTVKECKVIQRSLESAYEAAHKKMAEEKAERLREYQDSSEAVKSHIINYYSFRFKNLKTQKGYRQKSIDEKIEEIKSLAAGSTKKLDPSGANVIAAAKLKLAQLTARLSQEKAKREAAVAAALKSSDVEAKQLEELAQRLHRGEINAEEAQKRQEELK